VSDKLCQNQEEREVDVSGILLGLSEMIKKRLTDISKNVYVLTLEQAYCLRMLDALEKENPMKKFDVDDL
jgi:hypothetical protein